MLGDFLLIASRNMCVRVSAFLWTAHGVSRDLYVYIVYSPGLAYGVDVWFSAEHGGRFDSGVPIRSAQEVCDRSDNTVVSGRVDVAVCKTARGARQSMLVVLEVGVHSWSGAAPCHTG